MGSRQFLLTNWFSVLLVMCCMTVPAFASDGHEDQPFQPAQNVMQAVEDTLLKAQQNDKLALIILGANWCHDSMGLMRHFQEPEVEAVLEAHYERLLVDVGALDTGLEVVVALGLPVIYGTPTVLIVEPQSKRVINRRDLHQWYSADSKSVSQVVSYFSAKAKPGARYISDDIAVSGELEKLYAAIDRFEKEQAKRIYAGFKVVGPMVMMTRSERPKNFYHLWEQLRTLRYRIPEDIAMLRAVAKRRVAHGETDITLDFPSYPPLSWEQ